MGRHNSKSGLFLMEMIIVILFFSICAAICVNVFAAARVTADHSNDLNNAVVRASSAAEVYKAAGGNLWSATALLTEGVGSDVEDILCLSGTDGMDLESAALYSGNIDGLQITYADGMELTLQSSGAETVHAPEQLSAATQPDPAADNHALASLYKAVITVYSYAPSYADTADKSGRAELYSMQVYASASAESLYFYDKGASSHE